MIRHFVVALAFVVPLCPYGRVRADFRSAIVPQTTALRHGLTRPWFTQIRLDRGRARVCHMVLHEGVLYVQTDRALVHAIDGETGETLWAKHVGQANYPSLTPSASRDLLAIVNGSRLYLLNRYNGNLLYEVQVNGVPGAGAALSEKWAYVPTISGLMAAYRLEALTDPMEELGKINENPTEEEIAAAEADRREDLRLRQEYVPPLFCQSFGRITVQPVVTHQAEDEEFVVWPTDRGHLNVARVRSTLGHDHLAIKFRLETDDGIAGRPAYAPPDPNDPTDSGRIYVATRDGFVHALDETSEETIWRISTGRQILHSAVVIETRLYVATRFGGLYCLDAQTGREVWWAPRVEQFLAASKQRIYAADKLGNVLALDAGTGARLDTIPAAASPIKLVNVQTDRLYLATHTGLVQCLHEVGQSEPLRHGEARTSATLTKEPAAPAETSADDGVDEPLGGAEAPLGGEDAEAQDPVGGGADDDPFK